MALKTPIKTTNKILDISLKLFSTYGFENVKMQDIIDKLALSGYTKGAIYHHFKNKEDILYAILGRYDEQSEKIWEIERSQINGRDKLKALVLLHLKHILTHKEIIKSSLSLLRSMQTLAYKQQYTQTHLTPIVESMIEEGNSDGSLNVAYPKAASEMLVWGVYIWLDNALYPLSQMEYTYKVRHLRIMCEGVGLSVIDEEISAEFLALWREIR
ncbi:TetR-family transcriptional regulator [Helicobacter cinaedi]|uniref:TetR-family transcriptional regulator n=1 Tax=Helicobacter cinaedi TaxID=213 RepID=A0A377JV68_9HELI|nr:TetR/AcrR family transcriptional regulator [Helicobacter cinaedi]STP11786.1 TetR-family transcriptional regulator [Helicobacter cinaedi]